MKHFFQPFLLGLVLFCSAGVVFAQQEVSPVEVNGDTVEFDIIRRRVIAQGNVSVTRGETVLRADWVEFYKDTEIANARGHVVLEQPGQRVQGEELTFNFKTLKGGFDRPLLTAPPVYGSGESVEKVGENHFLIRQGYFSTCDFDDPQTRVSAKTIDVYPGDKAVARNMVYKVGKVPVFYWPKYSRSLKDNSSIVRITPGYSSDWGGFLLSRWRFDKNEDFKTFLHVDYRERKDVAFGLDNEYNTDFGSGMLRTYYMNERSISSERIWEERLTPTTELERYKAEWRHRWAIDDSTMAVAQFYKISDQYFLKDYFEREYEADANPDSYFIVTKGLTRGTVAARADYRVNRFTSSVDRLPEVSYSLPSYELFDSGFYWKNDTAAASLWQKNASPTDTYAKTKRFDLNNTVSYPAKISFVEVKPFVGLRQTYYTRTREESTQDAIRGVMRTGVDTSTKFYRIYDVKSDRWGLDINQLRHVITPSVAYEYQTDPTVHARELDQYDAVDALTRLNRMTLSFENKLQTKRNDRSVDLVRAIASTDFALEQDPLPGGYNNMTFDLEVTPYAWLGFYFDTRFNPQNHELETANFDLYINGREDRWFVRLGQRYHFDVDHLLETEVGWKFNQKWS
ncbi:MAG TPA: LPS assembly protein LptD, partial [Candidatus Bathyarchaeia archaeon]|nr:LPS assembly protein LptD [Candidatus Bathyarchaeia archaeon]